MIKSRGEQQLGRNPFDLTNRHVYTSKAGKITPVKAIHTYPDDYFEVEMSEFSQNNIPMNTAAFVSGKKELLSYFVPYNSVWHNFNQYQATREDPESTLLKEKGISFEPRIPLHLLYNSALYFYTGSFLFNTYIDLLTIRTICKSPDYNTFITDGMTGSEIIEYAKSHPWETKPEVDMWTGIRNSTYWYIRNNYKFDYFDNEGYLFGVVFGCYEYHTLNDENLTCWETYTNILGNFVWCDWCQKMDMLGYGNIYPTLKELDDKLKTLIDDMLSNSYINILGDDIFLYWKNAYLYTDDETTYDLLDDDFDPYITTEVPIVTDVVDSYHDVLLNMSSYLDDNNERHFEYVNVYAIYAYNKCFYDYMRNFYFDDKYYVYNYNCDFINGNTLAGSIINYQHLPLRWFHLESHQWKKDMFTGVLPDNQLGNVSELVLNFDADSASVSVSGSTGAVVRPADTSSKLYPSNSTTPLANNDLQSGADGIIQGQVGGTNTDAYINSPHTHSISVTGSVDLSGSSASLNVIALKRAEAIQQYRQDLMRAGNRTKDIFKQIFGTTPKSQLDETPYFIEVASNDINVNPIISTAQTGQELNGKLGDIAARSTISGGSLNFKFSTKDFGVIILMSYIIPESFYNSTRLDPFVTHLDQEAHGLPYFQNLGLQPVIGEFLSNMHGHDVRMSTRGFTPPYIERKTDIDLAHGNLVDTSFVEAGVQDINYQGSMSHWVVARTDMQSERTLTLRSFYINPRILDNVFTFNADDTYETDHYLTYCSIKVNAVRAFSEIGLPHF